MTEDEMYMQQALRLAEQAEQMNEVPVGAVVVLDDEIIGRGFNQPISLSDPSAHAEMVALRDAGRHMQNYRLPDATMYVTLEPCAMCAGLMVHARIKRLVYGASDPKSGACGSVMDLSNHVSLNHNFDVSTGVLARECSDLLTQFFARRRKEHKRK